MLDPPHPLYTEREVTAEPSLVGTWTGCGSLKTPMSRRSDMSTWVFQVQKGAAYGLTITSEGRTFTFSAHLVRLGRYLFLDVTPNDSTARDYGLYLPLHLIFKVWADRNALLLGLLPPDKIDLRGEPHFLWNGQVVLTGPPRHLQRLMVQLAEDPEVFKPDDAFCLLIREE